MNNLLSIRLLSILLSVTFFLVFPKVANADTTDYKSAGWVETDGSPAYSNTSGCQISNDGLYCTRPSASSFATLYFSSFGTLQDFGIPLGSSINKIHIKITGKSSDSLVVAVNTFKNQKPLSGSCQQPSDLWNIFLGSTSTSKEVHTFTSANGLTSCVTASNINEEKLTFTLRRSSGIAWSADIDNFEVAFDYSPPTYAWLGVGNLNIPRVSHNAVKLNDGKVLIAGGERTGLPVSQVETYDPTTKLWSFVKPLNTGRKLITMNSLPSNAPADAGSILIAGGIGDSGMLSSSELYNPSSNTWTNVGNLNNTRIFHASSILNDGKVLVTGGSVNASVIQKHNTTEMYDSVSRNWTLKGSLNTARGFHQQITYNDSEGKQKVMVIGGADGNGDLSSVEIYDSTTNQWTVGPSMSSSRRDFSSVLLHDGRILVVGGNNAGNSEVYNPATNSWTTYTPVSPIRTGSAIALLGSGSGYKVLASGGSTTELGAQLFDPMTNSWSAITLMNTPRSRFTMTTLNDGNVIVAGGISQGGQTTTSELYRPPQVLGDSTTPTPTVSVSPTQAPFLDLPWDYEGKGKTFDDAAMAINSYFDHEYPLQSKSWVFPEPPSVLNKLRNYLDSEGNGNLFTCDKHCYSGHDGYDYGSADAGVVGGDTVYPAAAGVAEYKYTTASGNLIYINHQNGYQTRYYHLKDKGIFEGKALGTKIDVVRNTPIASVGGTGTFTTGAHLHFSVFQDTDGDKDFEDEEPFGVTDPFGWVPLDSTKQDPWANYTVNHAGEVHKGNKSRYLWGISQANNELFIGPNGGSMTVSKAHFNFHPNTIPSSTKVKVQSAPGVKTEINGKKYKSIGHSFEAAAYDILGNLKDAFVGLFTLTIDFTELASYNIKPETISIYSSEDGTTWVKEETTVDYQNGNATAEINHMTYFALLAEMADTQAPVTGPSFNGSGGADKWFNNDVNVTLSATDNENGVGVEYLLYKLPDEDWQFYTVPLSFTEVGAYKISFYSGDKGGNVEDVKTVEFYIDKTAPVTTADVSGTKGQGGWNTSEVLVSLTAQDNGEVDRTEYSLDGGGSFVSYSEPVSVSGEGVTEITYRSVDKAGNVEDGKLLTVKIDKTVPSSLVYTTGVVGKNGWFRSDVVVSLNALEEGSGYDKTYYSFDGEAFVEYLEPIVIATEGTKKIYYYSTDKAGNKEERREFVVKIDKTAPFAEFMYDISAQDIKVTGKDNFQNNLSTNAIYTGTTGEIVIVDQAGNSLKILVKDKEKGKNARLSIVSLQYNDSNVITLDKNTFSVKYDFFDVTTNTIRKFDQDWKVNDVSKVSLSYSQNDDTTSVKTRNNDGTVSSTVVPGKKFLKVVTDTDILSYSY